MAAGRSHRHGRLDEIPDRIEQHYGLNPGWAGDALLDRDNDGVNNLAQYNAGLALDADLQRLRRGWRRHERRV
jgi:hypothetical protein